MNNCIEKFIVYVTPVSVIFFIETHAKTNKLYKNRINHLSTILEPYNFNRKVIGFDTFEGFRNISKYDSKELKESDFSDTSYEHLKEWSILQDSNRAVSHIEKIELIKGDASRTIPDYIEKNKHLIIALLYIDFDIYEPTKVALEKLLPLVPKGGIVGIDEVNC